MCVVSHTLSPLDNCLCLCIMKHNETKVRGVKYLANVMLVVVLNRRWQVSDAPTKMSVQLDRCLNVTNPLHYRPVSDAHQTC